MHKGFLLGFMAAAAAVMVFVAFSGFAQEDMKKVEDGGFKSHTRGLAPFNHDAHNQKAGIEDCGVCHHSYENGKKSAQTSEGTRCSECHLAGGKDSMDLIKAFHARCKGCHMQEKKGPITCAECHPNQ